MRKTYIGMDGGGTKTSGVLADDTGAILATGKAGASAIVGAPSPEACGVLLSLQAQLCQAAGVRLADIARMGLGLNGVDFPQ